MRCFLIYFFLFLFLLFLRRDPQSKGLFVKHAVSCEFFFFFFHREIQIHYLKRKKKMLALMSSWSGGKWVVVR